MVETIVTRAPPGVSRFAAVVAVVALAEPRMANIVGADALEVTIGAPVEVVFETRGEGRVAASLFGGRAVTAFATGPLSR